MRNHSFSSTGMPTLKIWLFRSLLLLSICISSCFTEKSISKRYLEGYKLVPIVCEFFPPSYDRGRLGVQMEIGCDSPSDTSFWMICNNKIKNVSCNYYSKETKTLYLLNNCKKEFLILNKDMKIACRVPFYNEYNMIRIGIEKTEEDQFIKEYDYNFYVTYN
jgi:hypothetical protein